MRNSTVIAMVVSLFFMSAGTPANANDPTASIDIGNHLAAVLRAGRSVVSNNQDLISDPAKGDKGLSGEKFRALVIENFQKTNGTPLLNDNLSPVQRQLTEAQLDAMVEVVNDSQGVINAPDIAFKGFIPAAFARQVNENFGDKMETVARVKVTAPENLVRNRVARPDAWENGVIESKFQSDDWPSGKAYSEEVEVDGKPAFRMLIPEYYSESCLACHGSPVGETDVTGFPKEGGSEGDLAGAISIILFK